MLNSQEIKNIRYVNIRYSKYLGLLSPTDPNIFKVLVGPFPSRRGSLLIYRDVYIPKLPPHLSPKKIYKLNDYFILEDIIKNIKFTEKLTKETHSL